MKVYLYPLAEYKFKKLLIYLEEEWAQSSKTNFLDKLQKKVDQISDHPKSNSLIEGFDEIHWCVVTPQSSSRQTVQPFLSEFSKRKGRTSLAISFIFN